MYSGKLRTSQSFEAKIVNTGNGYLKVDNSILTSDGNDKGSIDPVNTW